MKEQSSTLETTNPKIVLPNKDLVGVKKTAKEKIKTGKFNRYGNPSK